MAEKCTNTSSPVDRWMKPKPLAPLNHFTVPFSLTNCSFRLCADGITSAGRRSLPRSSDGWSQIESDATCRQKQKCRSVHCLRDDRSGRTGCDCLLFALTINRLLHQDFNLNRSLTCENDWTSYSASYNLGKRKSSGRLPVASCQKKQVPRPPRRARDDKQICDEDKVSLPVCGVMRHTSTTAWLQLPRQEDSSASAGTRSQARN